MNLFVWLILGVVIGYLGSLIMRSDADRGAVLSTTAGILGALLAARLLAPVLGGGPGQGFFSLGAVLVSLLGAVVLVGLVNLLRRGRLR
ncbi:MAG TPA: GlsB/YeaQ/YmgE family stress response membrane protein [Steroidobacteraceae bacterium]|nr:GlsB/YeaQ/YmgE family stress response membrane protein [Steroidobacteraceae bacterium]